MRSRETKAEREERVAEQIAEALEDGQTVEEIVASMVAQDEYAGPAEAICYGEFVLSIKDRL